MLPIWEKTIFNYLGRTGIFLFSISSLNLSSLSYVLYVRKDANSNRTAEYFKLLGKERVQRLFRIYQIDFEMFDYNHEIYVFS